MGRCWATLGLLSLRVAASEVMSRQDSDEAYVLEAYVLDMCDEVLGGTGQQGHRFDWLLGDPGATGRQVNLPVDSYWPGHQLVVAYRELQHDQPMPIAVQLVGPR